MKTIKFFSGALAVTLIATGLQSCNKDKVSNQDPASVPTEIGSTKPSSRMGSPWRQLYAVGNAPAKASLYSLSGPPGGLSATLMTGFFVGTTQVTNVTGLAYNNDDSTMIISTGPTSNFPNRILTYPYPAFSTPLTAPVSVPCPGITDIEYNEYDGQLYGILANSKVVSIASSGAVTVNLSPTIPAGRKLTGLCNYNALLSYCLSDGTPAPDQFYSYGPSGAPTLTLLFTTDWDGPGSDGQSYGGGTQYVDIDGWEIVTAKRYNKLVTPAPAPGPFAPMPAPSTVIFADVTSE
jgi:hypothetical protein